MFSGPLGTPDYSKLLGKAFGLDQYNQMYGTYANSMQNLSKSYDPWSKGGLNDFQQASQLSLANAAHPEQMLNQLSSSFQTSPYQQNLLDHTRQQMAANAAQTGMLGSQTGNLQLAQQMNDMTGKFQNQYVTQGLGVMGRGINTLAGLSPEGLSALDHANSLQQMAAQARLQGSLATHNARNKMWGDVVGLGLHIAPMLMGGPAGMAGGAGMASTLGATQGIGATQGEAGGLASMLGRFM